MSSPPCHLSSIARRRIPLSSAKEERGQRVFRNQTQSKCVQIGEGRFSTEFVEYNILVKLNKISRRSSTPHSPHVQSLLRWFLWNECGKHCSAVGRVWKILAQTWRYIGKIWNNGTTFVLWRNPHLQLTYHWQLELMKRKQSMQHFDQRQLLLLENAYYQVHVFVARIRSMLNYSAVQPPRTYSEARKTSQTDRTFHTSLDIWRPDEKDHRQGAEAHAKAGLG